MSRSFFRSRFALLACASALTFSFNTPRLAQAVIALDRAAEGSGEEPAGDVANRATDPSAAAVAAIEPHDRSAWLLAPVSGSISRGFFGDHEGVDIALPMNSAVRAAADGDVIHANWDNDGYGYMVWVDHGDGLRTLYAHLNRIVVKRGQRIARGQIVGLSGNTGWSLGPHLHFEISVRGRKQNPALFLAELAP